MNLQRASRKKAKIKKYIENESYNNYYLNLNKILDVKKHNNSFFCH